MTMDQGDERLDEVFEDERDETQGWYFDLPSGAWERQEQTNRRLRETLLNRSDDEDDVPRDPFTGQPLTGRKRFGLRRRKDPNEGTAKAPRFHKRSSDDEPVSAFERWRGGDDDAWSTEPGVRDSDSNDPTPLRPRRRDPEEQPSENDDDRPRSRWEEMFGAKAGEDNLLQGMRQWAQKDAEAGPNQPTGDAEALTDSVADDDGVPNILRRDHRHAQDAFEPGGEMPARAAEAGDEEIPRLLRRQPGETVDRDPPPGEHSRWEGAFGAAGAAPGGLGAWTDRRDDEADVPAGMETSDDTEDESQGLAEAGGGIEAMRAWARSDAPTGIPESTVMGDEPSPIDDDGGESSDTIEAMRAWALGKAPADTGGSIDMGDEPSAIDDSGDDAGDTIEAMRAWARGSARETEQEPSSRDDAVVPGRGIEALHAWARGAADSDPGAPVDSAPPQSASTESTSDDQRGIESFRAWARGDASGDTIDTDVDAPGVDDLEADSAGGFEAPEGPADAFLDEDDAIAPPDDMLPADEDAVYAEAPRKRGILSRLFGRKKVAPEAADSAPQDDAVVGSESGDIEDALDEAGWVVVHVAAPAGAAVPEEDGDIERLGVERDALRNLAENDEPALTAELLKREDGTVDTAEPESAGTTVEFDEPDELIDWTPRSETIDGEAPAAEGEEEAIPAPAFGVPEAPEEVADEDAPWTLVELLDDAEMLEEMLEGEPAAELVAASGEPAASFDPAETDEDSPWEMPGASSPFDGTAAASAEDDAEAFPWAAAALTEEALGLEEDEVAALADELVGPAGTEEAEPWAWAPELEDEELGLAAEPPLASGVADEFEVVSPEAELTELSTWTVDGEVPALPDPPTPEAASAQTDDDGDGPEAEISDEELATAVYFAEAYSEEAIAELGAARNAEVEPSDGVDVDEDELLLRYGWEEDIDDETFDLDFETSEPGVPDAHVEPPKVEPAPAQLSFDFGRLSVDVPAFRSAGVDAPVDATTVAEASEDADAPAETEAEPAAGLGWEIAADAIEEESIVASLDEAPLQEDSAPGWEMPGDNELAPAAFAPSAPPLAEPDRNTIDWELPSEDDIDEAQPIAASLEETAAGPWQEAGVSGWEMPGDDSVDDEMAPAAFAPSAPPLAEDDRDTVGWELPSEETEESPAAEPASAQSSLLSRFAAEVSAEPESQTSMEPAAAETPEEPGEAPDLWAAIAEEAASAGEEAESSDFDHPRVYGAPGQTSSLLSFYGIRDAEDEYVPDANFVAPVDELSHEDDLILRAFEAHAATEIEAEVPQEVEADPAEFDSLLGEGSQELVDEPGFEEPAGISYARLHDWPGMQGDASREDASGSWMLADEITASPATSPGHIGGPPGLPYADIDRPLPREDGEAHKQKTRTLVRELVETGLLALLVFLAVRASFQNFKVDGNSMYPTLEDGQFLIVNKLIYSEVDIDRLSNFLPFVNAGDNPTRHVFHPPQRGDIVVLRDPSNPSVDLIKRVIGMPGDKLEIYEGAVYIDDYLLEEPYIAQPWHDSRPAVLIPDGHYFVLGDNRDNSKDSRSTSIGFIPEELIIGRAELSYWPFSQFGRAPNDNPTISEAQGRPMVTTQKIERD